MPTTYTKHRTRQTFTSTDRTIEQAMTDLATARASLQRLAAFADDADVSDVMSLCRTLGKIGADAFNGLVTSGRGDELKVL